MARRLVLHFWSIQGLFRIVFNENPFIFITEMRKLLCTGLPMYLSVGVRIGVSAAGVSIGVSLRFFLFLHKQLSTKLLCAAIPGWCCLGYFAGVCKHFHV